jgi:hypothetical protein
MFIEKIKDVFLKLIYIAIWIFLLSILPVRFAFWLVGK